MGCEGFPSNLMLSHISHTIIPILFKSLNEMRAEIFKGFKVQVSKTREGDHLEGLANHVAKDI